MSQTLAASRRPARRRSGPVMAIDLYAARDVEPSDWSTRFVQTAVYAVTLGIALYHHEALLTAMRAVWA
ncbi:MAG TPA: hypothetical protein VGE51_15445 [Fontimonas sp.]